MSSSARPFPSDKATESFWRSNVLPIDTCRSTPDLPLHADIVIIGAGYSGASIAHHLLAEAARQGIANPSIVILEARQACSGATGRNGGHLKPDPYLRAAQVLGTYGKEVAEHVAAFEAKQVQDVKELVAACGIDCDFEETMVTDVCLGEGISAQVEQALKRTVAAGISTALAIEHHSGPEAERISGVRGAKTCLNYKAARMWPYRLVCHLLEACVARGVNLQTMTPVTSVVPGGDANRSGGGGVVVTARGSITAAHVIHATNGYSAALLPELRDKVVPVRGICARITGAGPSPTHPPIADSYMLRINDVEYDYLLPRPDGSIIVGGGRRDYFHDLASWFNVTDDGSLIDAARHYFDGYMQRHFLGWEHADDVRTDRVWTGIMGYSTDGFPFVGAVPARPGTYVCAGFTGHGMPQIFNSAKYIALLVLNGGSVDAQNTVPLPYQISPERWTSAREHSSLTTWRSTTRDRAPRESKV